MTEKDVEKDLSASDSDDVPTFSFEEEPLGIGAVYGFGYFQGGPGSTLGPQNRYKIQAKLGFGATSSVWLAQDDIERRYVSIKILTGKATQLNEEKNLQELKVYRLLSEVTPSDYTPRLLDHFIHPGIEDDGDHLCLVTELLHSDIRRAPVAADGFLPVLDLKRILTHVLRGLIQLHKCGVAHTDIKADNIMIDNERHWTTAVIDTWLKENPPRTHPPTQSLHKMVTVSVTQALPPPSLDMLVSCVFKLSDFGSAQILSQKTTDHITPLSLRPPEIVLEGDWDESVDIWTFGCLIFQLATNGTLFMPMKAPDIQASEEDVLLYQMILFCGEFFEPPLLQRCTRSPEFFRKDCGLIKFDTYPRKPFEKCIISRGRRLSPPDMEGLTDLMTKCLRLEPSNRSTAQQLLEHPWLMK